jgi:hypothetical protein
MNIAAIKKVESELIVNIHLGLINAVADVIRKCKKLNKKPEEPDFIASLTINFSRDLFYILESLFPKSKFAVTGVFCHQKPIVNIGANKNPELGDLLLIYIRSDKSNNRICNSLLLQAKKTKHQEHFVPRTEMHQLELYMNWPEFSYVKAGPLTGVSRNVTPKSVTAGAQYLLIDDDAGKVVSNFTDEFPMGCATPDYFLILDKDFATEITEFLKLKSGRSFDYDPSGTQDEWTRMIWDMLEATKQKARRRNSLPDDFDRQTINQVDGTCFFSSHPGSSSIYSDLHRKMNDQPGTIQKSDITGNDDTGLSIILIESNDIENPEYRR